MRCARRFLPFLLLAAGAPWWAPRASDTPVAAPLVLEEARARALRDNLLLKAAAAQLQASDGAVKQARALSNPQLEAQAEDFGGDLPRWGQSQTTYSVTQILEPWGQRSLRAGAAQGTRDATAQEVQMRTLDLLAEVERRFTLVLGAQERVTIAEENLTTAKEVTATVAALVKAGEVSPIEEHRAGSDESLSHLALQSAKRELELARIALAQLWGLDQPDFGRAEGSLGKTMEVPLETDFESLDALPDVLRLTAETRGLDAQLALAKRSRWPALAVNAGWRRYAETGQHGYVAGIAFSVPLFDRNAGAIGEASFKLERGKWEREAERLRIRGAYRAARASLSSAAEEATTLRDQVLPRSHQVYDAMNEGYRRGQFRLLDLLEARRSLAAARLSTVDALVRLGIAQADLRRFALPEASSRPGDQP
jgi:outer membrane protein, heavy metal efflux system